MVTFYKTSKLWVLDFAYDGRLRRWVKSIPDGENARDRLEAQVRDLYGKHGRVIDVRVATSDEETQYLQGTLPKNAICPTGRRSAEPIGQGSRRSSADGQS